jgi:curli biogenesis system outer membrane secretion channel CsgG
MRGLKTLFPMALAGVAIAGAARVAPAQEAAADSRPTVAIMYFNNGALGKSHEDLAPLSKGIADMMITEMAGNPGIRVVERDQLQKLLEEQNLSTSKSVDAETAVRIGKILGVHHMIFGGFVTDLKDNMRLDVRAVDVETSRVEYTESVRDKTDNLMQMIADLAAKMNKGMKLPAMPKRVADASMEKAGKVPLQAIMLYSRALSEKDQGHKDEAVKLFRASLDKYPDYEAPKKEIAKIEGSTGGGM